MWALCALGVHQGSDQSPHPPFLAMPGFSRCLLQPPLPYLGQEKVEWSSPIQQERFQCQSHCRLLTSASGHRSSLHLLWCLQFNPDQLVSRIRWVVMQVKSTWAVVAGSGLSQLEKEDLSNASSNRHHNQSSNHHHNQSLNHHHNQSDVNTQRNRYI